MSLVILLLVAFALGSTYEAGWGQEILKHATLRWKVSDYAVVFNLTVDLETHLFYDWYGIALKEPSRTVSMTNGDFAVAMFRNETLFHMNTFGYRDNGRPQNNTQSAFDSIWKFQSTTGSLSVMWARKFNESTKGQSINLQKGSKYTLLYAYGTLEEGLMQPHTSNDKGYGNITLSNTFSEKAQISPEQLGQETLKQGQLQWKMLSDRVVFNLTVDSEVTKDYDWYGFGLKRPSETVSMVKAEYFVLKNLSFPNLFHMNTFGYLNNNRPQNYAKKHFEITLYYFTPSNDLIFTWTKQLNTSANETLKLVSDKEYTLLFAYGKMSDGVIQKHEGTNRGYGTITLSNTFSGVVTIPSDDESAFSLCTLLILSVLQVIL